MSGILDTRISTFCNTVALFPQYSYIRKWFGYINSTKDSLNFYFFLLSIKIWLWKNYFLHHEMKKRNTSFDLINEICYYKCLSKGVSWLQNIFSFKKFEIAFFLKIWAPENNFCPLIGWWVFVWVPVSSHIFTQ